MRPDLYGDLTEYYFTFLQMWKLFKGDITLANVTLYANVYGSHGDLDIFATLMLACADATIEVHTEKRELLQGVPPDA